MTEKELIEKGMRFMELCKLLFSGQTDIYNINELQKESEFYNDAVNLANEMEINWEKMTHEDSNRIMLALLEDTYLAMKPDGGMKAVCEFKIKDESRKQ